MASKGYANLTKTFVLLAVCSCVAGYGAYSLQSMANARVSSCSYLDPVSIDLIAFAVGLFFIIEGCFDILQHAQSLVKGQVARCVRVSFGVCIITIHIMQVMHK